MLWFCYYLRLSAIFTYSYFSVFVTFVEYLHLHNQCELIKCNLLTLISELKKYWYYFSTLSCCQHLKYYFWTHWMCRGSNIPLKITGRFIIAYVIWPFVVGNLTIWTRFIYLQSFVTKKEILNCAVFTSSQGT